MARSRADERKGGGKIGRRTRKMPESGIMDSYVGWENSSNSATTRRQTLHVCHHPTSQEIMDANGVGSGDNSLDLKFMTSEDDGDDHFPPVPHLPSSTSTSSVKTLAMLQEHDATGAKAAAAVTCGCNRRDASTRFGCYL